MIFFALIDENVVGTAALIKHSDTLFELSKMAVSPSCQGQGIGKKLMDALINDAKKKGAQSIELITNTMLDRAIKLYTHTGFAAQPQEEFQSEYARGNLRMIVHLK